MTIITFHRDQLPTRKGRRPPSAGVGRQEDWVINNGKKEVDWRLCTAGPERMQHNCHNNHRLYIDAVMNSFSW